MYRNRKTSLILPLILLILLLFNNISIASGPNPPIEIGDYRAGTDQNILVKMIAGAFKALAMLLYNLLDSANLSIDKLVFSQGDGPFSGLSLFKPGDTQNFLATFYNLFQYLALGLFMSIMLWSVKSISDTGDNPQAKSVMKDRLNRVVFTLVLLYTMPELLTLLAKVSNGFVTIFKSVGQNFGDTTGIGVNESNELIKNYINSNLLIDDYTIIDAITSLMLVGINLWLVFFYIIRDLTVSFLFILFPIMAVFYPFSKDMVKNWWKNMLSNVLAQPIQAFVLTTVIALSNNVGGIAGSTEGSSSFASSVYTLVAFGSIIPMTSIIKSFLGIETGVGAGSSRAGLSGIMGAMMLARGMGRALTGNVNTLKEGLSERTDIKTAQTQVEKNLPTENSLSSREALGRPLPNQTANILDNIDTSTETGRTQALDALKRQERVANKKILKGVGSTALGIGGGAFGAVAGASIGAGYGGAQGARTFGMIGAGLGGAAGVGIGHLGAESYDLGQGIYQNVQMEKELEESTMAEARNMLFEQGIKETEIDSKLSEYSDPKHVNYNEELMISAREKAENKYVGLDHSKLNGTNWQAAERQALLSRRRMENLSTSNAMTKFAKAKYTELTPERKSPEELKTITDAKMYQDNDKSIIYRDIEDGRHEILAVSQGNPYLEKATVNPVSFIPSEYGKVPDDILFNFQTIANERADSYMLEAYPNIEKGTAEYMSQRNSIANGYKREMQFNYEDNLKNIQDSIGMPGISVKTNNNKLQELVSVEKAKFERDRLALQQQVAIRKRITATIPLSEITLSSQ